MENPKKNNVKEIMEWILCIVIAVVLALLVRQYIFTPTVVEQQSMYSTLVPHDRLILNRLCITTKQEIKRGEIITFEAPTDNVQYNKNNPVATYNNEPTGLFSKFTRYVLELGKTSYIKRVIGVAGDKILIENGKVYVNRRRARRKIFKRRYYNRKNRSIL